MLTTDTLFQQYESSWSVLSPRRQAAFRGNLTWLLSRTSDPAERTRLMALRERIQPSDRQCSTSAANSTARHAPRTYAVSTTTLQLRRRTVRFSDV